MFEDLQISDVKLIGRGGSASVYSAIDPTFGPVAVKVLRTTGPNPVSRFRREVEALSVLDGLDGVVRVLATGQTSDGDPFIVMPLMTQSLQRVIGTWGPMRWMEAARIVADVAEVVHQAHVRGVIHADIKPENLLLDEANNVYVSDFGIARVLHPTTPTVTTPGWTPTYAAPEVEAGQRATASADVYSLGATLAALVTGNRGPGSGEDRKAAIEAMMSDLATIVPGRSVADTGTLTSVVATAMSPDPADRYRSAQDLADAIRHSLAEAADRDPTVIRDGQPTPQGGPSPDMLSTERTPRRHRLAWSVAALVLLAAAGVGGYAIYQATEGQGDVASGPVAEALSSAATDDEPEGSGTDDDTDGADTTDVEENSDGETTDADGAQSDVVIRPGCAVTAQPGDDLQEALGGLVPGESLCLAPGTHTVTSSLRPGDGVRLVGADAENTRLVADDELVDSAVIFVGGGEAVIERLTVAFEGELPDVDVVAVGDAVITIDDVVITGGTRHGLSVFGASAGTVRRSRFVGNGGNGLVVGDTSVIEVGDSTAEGNGFSGFVWTGDSGGAALGSTATANANVGFEVTGSAAPDLIGNVAAENSSGFFWYEQGSGSASGNTASDSRFDGFGTSGQAAPRLVGNTARDNTAGGFAFGEGSSPTAVDNQAEANEHGFVVWGDATPTLEANTASGNDNNGFVWYDQAAGTTDGNEAIDNGAAGFSFFGSATPAVSGSTASGNSGGSIAVADEAAPVLTDNEF